MHDLDRTQLETVGIGELTAEATTPLNEAMELQVAAELLEVAGEQELDRFLGSLISRGAKAAGRFLSSGTGRALTGILKGAARKALPIAGRGIGEWVRPGGGAAGARMATAAGQMLGLELEGLSPEDREFEVARQFVRFATAAGRCAASLPGTAPPPLVARRAALAAARNYAPGFVPSIERPRRPPLTGRWVRRGNSIKVLGV